MYYLHRSPSQFLTSAYIVVARLCFHRRLSLYSRGRGVSQHALGQTPPLADTPLGRYPPGRHPPRQTPPGRIPPRQTSPLHDGYCSGQYASCWNAFVLSHHVNRPLNIKCFIQLMHFCHSFLLSLSLLQKTLCLKIDVNHMDFVCVALLRKRKITQQKRVSFSSK